MSKAVTYVRVSSKEQRDEGYSIPAQRKLLKEYARRNSLKIVAEFEEAETAKQAGRTEFERMVKFLKKHKDVGHILAEKTDRLSRNFRDYVTIGDLGRDVHYVKEGQVMGPNARASDKFIHDIKMAIAKNYVDNLSEETRKGMREKAEQGLYPSVTPLGYLNDKETKGIVIDWARAHLIREMFGRYANGESLRHLGKNLYDLGLRSKKGKPVANSMLARMLQNPIYTGDFEWGGKYYQGKHEPLILRSLFDRVQEQFKDKSKSRPKKRNFAFRGLLKCGECGCAITAEVKKGRYVYYRCTHGRGNCSQKPIREERLAQILGEPLKRVRMSQERLEWIIKALRNSHEDQKKFNRAEVSRLRAEVEEAERKIDALYEDKLAGVVPVEFWERKYRELSKQRDRLNDLISEHEDAKNNYLEDGIRILELAQDAYRLYFWQDPFEQQKILEMILSNSTLKDGEITTEFKELFKVLADGAEREEEMRAENAPKKAIDDIWLPGSNPSMG